MADAAVVNASPLILLSRAGALHLLQGLRPRIVVPAAVLVELQQKGPDDIVVRAVEEASWLERAAVAAVPTSVVAWDLGAGESAVLACALASPAAIAVLDDLAARRCAQALGVPLLGTAGVVLLAKRRGLIAEARPVLDRLVESGMYLSPGLYAELLRRAAE